MTSLGIILIIAALGVVAYHLASGYLAESRSEKVMETLERAVPQYDDGEAAATGKGEDPLPMLEIDGISFVGYLEVPGQGIEIPVAGADYDGSKFVFQDSGSPVKGRFKIGGKDSRGLFGPIDEIKPGERVTFVDVNGVRYNYKVTGLGSVKDWTDVDHDLILYRGVSRNIQFAVFAEME